MNEGLTGSIFGYLPVILIFRSVTSIMIILMIINPILGFLGGYVAKSLRLRLENENNQDGNKSKQF